MGFGTEATAIASMERTDYLLVGYDGGEVALFNLLDNQRLTITKAHEKPIRKILYNCATRHITTLAEDGHVKIWELRVGIDCLFYSGYRSGEYKSRCVAVFLVP